MATAETAKGTNTLASAHQVNYNSQDESGLSQATVTPTKAEVDDTKRIKGLDWEGCSRCDPPELITFDCDGDLILDVGEVVCEHRVNATGQTSPVTQAARTFRVCSKTLRRASPVFKRMLYGGFAEAQPPEDDKQWLVELPDDDPDALAVFCHIMHGSFEKVPSSAEVIDLELLYQITILSDKYDLLHLLRPWAWQWRVLLVDGYSNWSRTDEKMEKGLFIAWELGDYDLVCKFATEIAYYSCSNANGDLLRDKAEQSEIGNLRFQGVIPPADLKEVVALIRLHWNGVFLDYLHEAVYALIEKRPGILTCISPKINQTDRCEASMLGTIMRGMHQLHLWPLPEKESSITAAPATGMRRVLATLEGHIKSFGGHDCESNFRKDILDAIEKSIEPQFNDTHKKHCARQASRSGLS